MKTINIGIIIIVLFLSCTIEYDSHHYQHDKCLFGEQCTQYHLQIYDPGIENCPPCLECIDNIWVEIDCEEYEIRYD